MENKEVLQLQCTIHHSKDGCRTKERELCSGEKGCIRLKPLQEQLWSKLWACVGKAGVRILYVLLRGNGIYRRTT